MFCIFLHFGGLFWDFIGGFFVGIFWEVFLRGIFLGGFFGRIFLGRIFLGGFLGELFLEDFRRNSLGIYFFVKMLVFVKILGFCQDFGLLSKDRKENLNL